MNSSRIVNAVPRTYQLLLILLMAFLFSFSNVEDVFANERAHQRGKVIKRVSIPPTVLPVQRRKNVRFSERIHGIQTFHKQSILEREQAAFGRSTPFLTALDGMHQAMLLLEKQQAQIANHRKRQEKAKTASVLGQYEQHGQIIRRMHRLTKILSEEREDEISLMNQKLWNYSDFKRIYHPRGIVFAPKNSNEAALARREFNKVFSAARLSDVMLHMVRPLLWQMKVLKMPSVFIDKSILEGGDSKRRHLHRGYLMEQGHINGHQLVNEIQVGNGLVSGVMRLMKGNDSLISLNVEIRRLMTGVISNSIKDGAVLLGVSYRAEPRPSSKTTPFEKQEKGMSISFAQGFLGNGGIVNMPYSFFLDFVGHYRGASHNTMKFVPGKRLDLASLVNFYHNHLLPPQRSNKRVPTGDEEKQTRRLFLDNKREISTQKVENLSQSTNDVNHRGNVEQSQRRSGKDEKRGRFGLKKPRIINGNDGKSIKVIS